MPYILACIDGSPFADSVCVTSAWAAKQLAQEVALLHVAAPHSEMHARSNMSGAIGLGAKHHLLEDLAQIDEEHGRLEQQKGELMLEHAKDELTEAGIADVRAMHRRGALVDTISELEHDADLIIMGKRGEQAAMATNHLGSNLERVARAVHTPLLTVRAYPVEMESFVIAYDGSESAGKAIEYIAKQPLLKGMLCHILSIGEVNDNIRDGQEATRDMLVKAGYDVTCAVEDGECVASVIQAYVKQHKISLLVAGAYGHSQLRNFILGSTTTALLQDVDVPVLLFR